MNLEIVQIDAYRCSTEQWDALDAIVTVPPDVEG